MNNGYSYSSYLYNTLQLKMSRLTKGNARKIYKFLNVIDKYNIDDLYDNRIMIPCDENEVDKIIREIKDDKILSIDTKSKLISFAQKQEISYQQAKGYNNFKFISYNMDESYHSITYVLILLNVWNVINKENNNEKKQLLNQLFEPLTIISFDIYVKYLMSVVNENNSCVLL